MGLSGSGPRIAPRAGVEMDPARKRLALVFGSNAAKRRRELGDSQETTAYKAGLHRTAVGQIERGERLPSLDTAVKLASVLGTSLNLLAAGIVWHPPSLTKGEFSETKDAADE